MSRRPTLMPFHTLLSFPLHPPTGRQSSHSMRQTPTVTLSVLSGGVLLGVNSARVEWSLVKYVCLPAHDDGLARREVLEIARDKLQFSMSTWGRPTPSNCSSRTKPSGTGQHRLTTPRDKWSRCSKTNLPAGQYVCLSPTMNHAPPEDSSMPGCAMQICCPPPRRYHSGKRRSSTAGRVCCRRGKAAASTSRRSKG